MGVGANLYDAIYLGG